MAKCESGHSSLYMQNLTGLVDFMDREEFQTQLRDAFCELRIVLDVWDEMTNERQSECSDVLHEGICEMDQLRTEFVSRNRIHRAQNFTLIDMVLMSLFFLGVGRMSLFVGSGQEL